MVTIAADAGANESRQPALTPDRNTFNGCILALVTPASHAMAVTSAGVYALPLKVILKAGLVFGMYGIATSERQSLTAGRRR